MLSGTQIQTLKDDILNGPLAADCAPLISAGNAAGIVDLYNAQNRPTTVVVPESMYNHRRLMAELPPDTAATILDKLEAAAASNSVVKWALFSIKSDAGIDLGHPNTRAQLAALATAGVITASEAAQLKALAERSASRAEELFGLDVAVSLEDIWRTGVI